MFELEKDEKKPFEFDLEVELKSDPAIAKALLKDVEERIAKLKNLLRQGADSDDFDDYGVVLHGYAALQKVLKRAIEKK